MPTKTWTVPLADWLHTVTLLHGTWLGKRVVTVDGQVQVDGRKLFDTGDALPIQIGAQPAVVQIRSTGISYRYDLLMGGHSVTTGQAVTVPVPVPGWGVLCGIICAVVGVVGGRGSLVSIILGVGGSLLCTAIARNLAWPTALRATLCAGLTLLTVVLVFALLTLSLPARP